jgi:hypothetical protein
MNGSPGLSPPADGRCSGIPQGSRIPKRKARHGHASPGPASLTSGDCNRRMPRSPDDSASGGLKQTDSQAWTGSLPPTAPLKALPLAPSGASSVMSDKISAWADENQHSAQGLAGLVESMFSMDEGLAARRHEALHATVTRTVDGGNDKTKVKELSQIAKVARRCLKQLDEREGLIKDRVRSAMCQMVLREQTAGDARGAHYDCRYRLCARARQRIRACGMCGALGWICSSSLCMTM